MAHTYPLTGIGDQLQKAFMFISSVKAVDRMSEPDVQKSPRPGALFPDLNILETANSYVISVETPGIDARDILVSVREGRLSLRVANQGRFTRSDLLRKMELAASEGTEQYFDGSLQELSLPANIVPDQVVVDTEDGILRIILSKLPGHRRSA